MNWFSFVVVIEGFIVYNPFSLFYDDGSGFLVLLFYFYNIFGVRVVVDVEFMGLSADVLDYRIITSR